MYKLNNECFSVFAIQTLEIGVSSLYKTFHLRGTFHSRHSSMDSPDNYDLKKKLQKVLHSVK